MPEFKLNGKTYSGSTSYASAIDYTEADGSKTTVQDKISELDENISEQNKNFIGKPNRSNMITIGNNPSSYVAPSDGYFSAMYANGAGAFGQIEVKINDTLFTIIQGNQYYKIPFNVVLCKGDTISFTYEMANINLQYVYFIPCK